MIHIKKSVVQIRKTYAICNDVYCGFLYIAPSLFLLQICKIGVSGISSTCVKRLFLS